MSKTYYRPVMVNDELMLFHDFRSYESGELLAVCEDKDGKIHEIEAENITFIDDIYKKVKEKWIKPLSEKEKKSSFVLMQVTNSDFPNLTPCSRVCDKAGNRLQVVNVRAFVETVEWPRPVIRKVYKARCRFRDFADPNEFEFPCGSLYWEADHFHEF